MFDLRYRPGCYKDLPQAVPLLQAECESLGADIWRDLPALISKLMEAEVVKTYVIDEGQGARLRWFGLSAFVDPAALEQALQRSAIPFRRSLLKSALDGGSPFMTQKQIGVANAHYLVHQIKRIGLNRCAVFAPYQNFNAKSPCW